MPTARPQQPIVNKQFTSWSYSRLADYDPKRGGCPRFAAWKHLAKVPTAGSAAMERGTMVHLGAEHFVTGVAKKVLPELKLVKPVLEGLKKLKRVVQTEANWGFTRAWQACDWRDWDNCWLRVKMDVHYLDPKLPVLEMIDWKTGRPKPEANKDQLKLYGASGLARFPAIEKAHGVLHYTDHGTKEELTVARREDKTLRKYWELQVKPMFADKRFAPAPGPKCKWCDFSKSKGGACEF